MTLTNTTLKEAASHMMLGLSVAAGGAIVLIGWLFQAPSLLQIMSAHGPMEFYTAVMFVMAGISLMLPTYKSRLFRLSQSLLGGLLILFSGLLLSEHFFDANLGLTPWFLPASANEASPHLTRIAPNICIAFMLFGAVLILTRLAVVRSTAMIVKVFTCLLIVIGLIGIIGYVLELDSLYHWYRFSRMNLSAGAGLTALGCGLALTWCEMPYCQDTASRNEGKKITIMGALILVAIASASGLTGFLVVKERVAQLLGNNLHSALQSRIVLFQSEVDQSIQLTSSLITLPGFGYSANKFIKERNTEAQVELGKIVQSFVASGISGISIYDNTGKKLTDVGQLTDKPILNVPINAAQETSLLWSKQGFILRTRVNLINQNEKVGAVVAERVLSNLTRSVNDVRVTGHTGTIELCGPVDNSVRCFPTQLTNNIPAQPLYNEKENRAMGLALAKQTGFIKTLDAKKNEVIAAYGPISNTGLGMVMKIDSLALYQPVREQLQLILPWLFALIIFGVFLLRSRVTPLAMKLVEIQNSTRNINQALEEKEQRLSMIVENIGEGLITLDRSGLIRSFNIGAVKMLGYDADEIFGKEITLIIPSELSKSYMQSMRYHIENGMSELVDKGPIEMQARRKDGSIIQVEIIVNELRLGDDNLFVVILHDISERKKNEAEIVQAKERLDLALTGSNLALFEWNIKTGIVYLSDRWAAMHGLESGPMSVPVTELIQYVPEEERKQLRSAVYKALKGHTPFYQVEHRYFRPPGSWLWIQCHGQVVERDVRGRALRLTGTCADITQRKEHEAALQHANDKLESGLQELAQRNREISLLSKLSNVLQSCLTMDEAFTAIGKFCGQLFPQESGTLYIMNTLRNHLQAVSTWGPAQPSQHIIELDQCWSLRRGQLYRMDDTAADLVCDHILPYESQVKPYLCIPLNAQGETLGLIYFCSTQDTLSQKSEQLAGALAEQIALALANIRLRDTLRQQSIRDSLTGLFNRRYLEESLRRELARMTRKQASLVFAMVDIDHFKRFNDNYGHEAGDTVLMHLGDVLRTQIRTEDIACRFGGEEFALILPEADLQIGLLRAERIRKAVHQLLLKHQDQPLDPVTVSIGVAVFPDHGEDLESLMRAADAALYQAKSLGRNRVIVAGNKKVKNASCA